jgi:glycogen debranching enzyme
MRADNGQELESESLLLYMPLVLGKRLPIAVQEKLVEGLTRHGRFRTSYGFSSEALTSEYYTPDGYWRGPIWAPTSMLLAEGLDSIGEHRIARDLRVDFCKMVQRSGIFENFDAKTGIGLRDSAYTWTSSVYLIFAHQLWEENRIVSAPAKDANRTSSRQ